MKRLVWYDREKAEYVPDDEGLKVLRDLEEDVLCVIAVTGKFKTGKTYLCERVILEYKPKGLTSASSVSHTVKQGTKGIWIFPDILTTDDGRKIIVLDCEGLGSVDGDPAYDARLFTISMLLSSLIVYNSIGSIDEVAIEGIEFMCQLAKEIKAEDSKGRYLAELFPKFVWLLRDFSLKLEDPSGKKLTPDEYFEACLEYSKGNNEMVEKRNRTRRIIKEMFSERECFTMIRPALTEFEVQRLDKMRNSELRPEFVDQCKKFRNKLVKVVKVKRVASQNVTGRIMIEYLHKVLASVNGRNSIVLPAIHVSVVKSFNEKILKEFEDLVKKPETKLEMISVESYKNKAMGEKKDIEILEVALNNILKNAKAVTAQIQALQPNQNMLGPHINLQNLPNTGSFQIETPLASDRAGVLGDLSACFQATTPVYLKNQVQTVAQGTQTIQSIVTCSSCAEISTKLNANIKSLEDQLEKERSMKLAAEEKVGVIERERDDLTVEFARTGRMLEEFREENKSLFEEKRNWSNERAALFEENKGLKGRVDISEYNRVIELLSTAQSKLKEMDKLIGELAGDKKRLEEENHNLIKTITEKDQKEHEKKQSMTLPHIDNQSCSDIDDGLARLPRLTDQSKNTAGLADRSGLDNSVLTLRRTPTHQKPTIGIAVDVMEFSIKESKETKKLYVEFRLRAKKGKREWDISKVYGDFCELWKEIRARFPKADFPQNVKDRFSLNKGSERASQTHEKQKELQDFLSAICANPMIAESHTFRRFVDEDPHGASAVNDASQTFNANDDTSYSQSHSFTLREYARQNLPKDIPKPPRTSASPNVALKPALSSHHFLTNNLVSRASNFSALQYNSSQNASSSSTKKLNPPSSLKSAQAILSKRQNLFGVSRK